MSVYYSKDHEWISVDGDTATIGITDFAQGQLGDVVFVEVPEAGRRLEQGGEAAVVESVKAASDVYAPVAGTVTAVNEELRDKPEAINAAAFEAWMYKLKPANAADVAGLLDAAKYQANVDAQK